ncbi:MAG TPA: glutamate-1-semialdehyde 2,1-aminomutase [Candidatus Dormibacteraeota bacterium]|nr:glutamate-1-semialdehyde 2,1-aminomutase [Candidatus Dormibacteraeota bacterium]
MRTGTSEKLFAEALAVIPGGVNSPVRAWKAVGGHPRFIQRAAGCTITDADGNSYIDYVGSWGPMIVGHAHHQVLRAIHEAMKQGTSFGAPTPREIELARRIVGALPSVEQVRLVSSGTEATMTAIRLARAFTKRPKIVKFDGCYHGHADPLLVRAGSGAMTLGIPDSGGVPEAIASLTLVARFNDLAEIEARFAAEGDAIAAVIVEPVVGNMGLVPPAAGFLDGLRRVSERHGALLIIDEVMTGFRLAWGGVQVPMGIRPDLTCLGKVIGGGMPLAAVGGRRDVMQQLAPIGGVYQAGTLSGNPLAVSAGLATLALLDQPGVYERLETLGAQLEAGLTAALRRHGCRGCVQRAGSMWTLFFGVDAVADAEQARAADTAAFGRFFTAMLERGVYLPPSQFEAAFISLAHSEGDIDTTITAADQALASI